VAVGSAVGAPLGGALGWALGDPLGLSGGYVHGGRWPVVQAAARPRTQIMVRNRSGAFIGNDLLVLQTNTKKVVVSNGA
jgi:hypothetical protein